MDLLLTLLTSIIAVAGTIAGGWLTNHYSLKRDAQKFEVEQQREKQLMQQEQNKLLAEDLDKIIYPAINSLEISEFIKRPKELRTTWFTYLIYDETNDLEQELILILNSLKARVNSNTIIKLIQQTLLEKYDLNSFFKRYNRGTYLAVDLDIDLLNTDITFINSVLGKHYTLFLREGD